MQSGTLLDEGSESILGFKQAIFLQMLLDHGFQ